MFRNTDVNGKAQPSKLPKPLPDFLRHDIPSPLPITETWGEPPDSQDHVQTPNPQILHQHQRQSGHGPPQGPRNYGPPPHAQHNTQHQHAWINTHPQSQQGYAQAPQTYPRYPQSPQHYLQSQRNYAHGPQNCPQNSTQPLRNQAPPWQTYARPPHNLAQTQQNCPQAPPQGPSHQKSQNPQQHYGQAPQQNTSHASVQRTQQYGCAHPAQRPPHTFGQARQDTGAPWGPSRDPLPRLEPSWTTQTTNAPSPQSAVSMRTQIGPDPRSHQPLVRNQPMPPRDPRPVVASQPIRDSRVTPSGGGNGDEDQDYAFNNYQNANVGRPIHVQPYIRPTLNSRSGSRTGSETGSGDSQTSQALTMITAIDTARASYHRTPHNLAESIKRGETEDPAQERILDRKYTQPSKLVEPIMGPTLRFQESHFFSRVDPIGPEPSMELVRSGLAIAKDIPNPDWLSTVQQGLCAPTVDELMRDLPITELFRMVAPSTAGVLRILDIPYATTRSEILAFLGRSARVLRLPEASTYPAIHIMMERETGKTLDCYVEVASQEEAEMCMATFKRRSEAGRIPRIAERTVEVKMSSQAELLAELFPRAKHVSWRGAQPIVDMTPRSYYEGETAVGFQGFIHPEEFVLLLKHAALKERSPFSFKSVSRPYETLITIMYKYPWYSPKYIPIHERDRIFRVTCKLMGILIEDIKKSNGNFGPGTLSPALLQEMTIAVLVCPGFTEVQKARVIANLTEDKYDYMVQNVPNNMGLGGNHALAPFWPFVALSVTPGADNALVQYYGHAFHQATFLTPGLVTFGPTPMGTITINYNGSDSPNDLTLSTTAKIERAKIEELLVEFVKHHPVPGQLLVNGQPALHGQPPDREDTLSSLDSRSPTPTVYSSQSGQRFSLPARVASNEEDFIAQVKSQRQRALTLAQAGYQRRSAAQAFTDALHGRSQVEEPQRRRGVTMLQATADISDPEYAQDQTTPLPQRQRSHNLVRDKTEAQTGSSRHNLRYVQTQTRAQFQSTYGETSDYFQGHVSGQSTAGPQSGDEYGMPHTQGAPNNNTRPPYHSQEQFRSLSPMAQNSFLRPIQSNKSDPSTKNAVSTNIRSEFPW